MLSLFAIWLGVVQFASRVVELSQGRSVSLQGRRVFV